MPQLDRIIIFSQIFWLFIVFTIFYTSITHFYLPNFLKSLKARKQILMANSEEIDSTFKQSLREQIFLKEILLKNLKQTKNILLENSVTTLTKKTLNFNFVDEKVGMSIINLMQYCDSQILNSVSLYPNNIRF